MDNDKPEVETVQAVSLKTRLNSAPQILVGIKTLECGNGDHLRARAFAKANIDADRFDVNMGYWIHPAELQRIEASYLYITKGFLGIRRASCVPIPYNHFAEDPSQTTRMYYENVVFDQAYDVPPTVVVWLSYIDSSKDNMHRFEVAANDVTRKGFRLEFHTWLESKFFWI